MNELKPSSAELAFSEIVWAEEPITTAELVRRCFEELNWKRTTTYTVLKRLSDRGFFQMKDSVVTSLISRDEYFAERSRSFVETSFNGSLPAFLAAFSGGAKLSEEEIEELQRLIDSHREDSKGQEKP